MRQKRSYLNQLHINYKKNHLKKEDVLSYLSGDYIGILTLQMTHSTLREVYLPVHMLYFNGNFYKDSKDKHTSSLYPMVQSKGDILVMRRKKLLCKSTREHRRSILKIRVSEKFSGLSAH